MSQNNKKRHAQQDGNTKSKRIAKSGYDSLHKANEMLTSGTCKDGDIRHADFSALPRQLISLVEIYDLDPYGTGERFILIQNSNPRGPKTIPKDGTRKAESQNPKMGKLCNKRSECDSAGLPQLDKRLLTSYPKITNIATVSIISKRANTPEEKSVYPDSVVLHVSYKAAPTEAQAPTDPSLFLQLSNDFNDLFGEDLLSCNSLEETTTFLSNLVHANPANGYSFSTAPSQPPAAHEPLLSFPSTPNYQPPAQLPSVAIFTQNDILGGPASSENARVSGQPIDTATNTIETSESAGCVTVEMKLSPKRAIAFAFMENNFKMLRDLCVTYKELARSTFEYGLTLLHKVSKLARDDPLQHDHCISMATFLVQELKVKVNVPAANGSTPLHHAACGNNIEYMKLLITLGAEVDIKTEGRYLPIHNAVLNRQKKSIQFFAAIHKEAGMTLADLWLSNKHIDKHMHLLEDAFGQLDI